MIDAINICGMNKWMNRLRVDLIWMVRERERRKKHAKNHSQISDFNIWVSSYLVMLFTKIETSLERSYVPFYTCWI